MARGRYGGPRRKKGSDTQDRVSSSSHNATPPSTGPIFHRLSQVAPPLHDRSAGPHFSSPLLVTLLFESRTAQHAALSRIEAFYESTSDARRYLTLQEASQQRLCPNYEAFNCPISIVREWLEQMRVSLAVEPSGSRSMSVSKGGDLQTGKVSEPPAALDDAWWRPFCNHEEVELLTFLSNLACLGNVPEAADPVTPQYLVTALTSQAASSLPHERLHFLYFIAPSYRELVQEQFAGLSAKSRKVIETDLRMRGYSSQVWPDEFQAYVSLDAAEFGKKTCDECIPIQQRLIDEQRLLWKSLSSPSNQA